MDIIDVLSGNSYIIFNKDISRKLGVECAILLGEMCNYQAIFGKDKEFYREEELIAKDTTLTVYAVRKAKEILKENNILKIRKIGLPAKHWFQINKDGLEEFIHNCPVTASDSVSPITSGNENITTSGNENITANYNTLSNDKSLSNDIIKNNKEEIRESRNTDFATQRSGSTDKNSVKITDSAEEVNKIKNSTVCQLVEKEKNKINPPDPLYSSDEEKSEQKDDFDDLFGEPVGTDRKSRLAQTNNSNGTLAKELFDYWNSKKLRVHRAFQSHYIERFSKLMQNYTMEQIKHIIDNYEKIVHDKVYYWSYVWDLQDFIDPREERFLRFADDGQEWLNYKQGTKSQQAFRRTAFHNEEYNQALKEGKDIGALDDMHAEEVRKLRSSPNVIKL